MLSPGWWPLARVADVDRAEPRPLAVLLDGTGWALARLDGRMCGLRDLCPHQDFPLSEGIVVDGADVGRPEAGQLVQCDFHGWAFDGAGRCVVVPTLPGRDPRVPGPAVLDVVEAHGLVWGAVGEPGAAPHGEAAVALEPRTVARPLRDCARLVPGTGLVEVATPAGPVGCALSPVTASSTAIFVVLDEPTPDRLAAATALADRFAEP